MQVNFKRKWFGPSGPVKFEGSKNVGVGNPLSSVSGKLYKPDDNPNNVPDSLRSLLPRDAEIVGEGFVKDVRKAEARTLDADSLRNYDTLRAAAYAEQETVNGQGETKDADEPEEDTGDGSEENAEPAARKVALKRRK